MRLIIATKNENKVRELKKLLEGSDITLSSLFDYPEIGEIPEDGKTFVENAVKKAEAVQRATGEWVLADDSGLVVPALGGAPGIYSSRYAGREKDYAANNKKLLREMKNIPEGERKAAFVCVMVLMGPGNRRHVVEGRCEGEIAHAPRGEHGFGYDPIFLLPDRGQTMAELPLDEKNRISHRGCALQKVRKILIEFLKET